MAAMVLAMLYVTLIMHAVQSPCGSPTGALSLCSCADALALCC